MVEVAARTNALAVLMAISLAVMAFTIPDGYCGYQSFELAFEFGDDGVQFVLFELPFRDGSGEELEGRERVGSAEFDSSFTRRHSRRRPRPRPRPRRLHSRTRTGYGTSRCRHRL